MERFIQHDPLFIRHFSTLTWPFPVHNHNHFELMFIHKGSGYHTLNGERKAYQGKALFLLAPADSHIFDIVEETEFSVLKFTNTYLGGDNSTKEKDDWNKLLDQLIASATSTKNQLVGNPEDLEKISVLIRLVVAEWKTSSNPTNEVVFYLIRSVFALIRKNRHHSDMKAYVNHGDLTVDIMETIHINIENPNHLRLEWLSAKFGLSQNYMSSIFKKKTGVSLKHYIDECRFQRIENRLLHSRALFKEISNEFGFTDLSHFNKFVKKFAGISPKQIRKSTTQDKFKS